MVTRYLTYFEYLELGGDLPEDAFNSLERVARNHIDTMTFDRIKIIIDEGLPIPQIVKEVMFEFIRQLYALNNQQTVNGTITQYSNGVEQFTYHTKTDTQTYNSMYKLARMWLPDYLTCREVGFDVREYLQSNNNSLQ